MTDSTAVLAPGQRILDANGDPVPGAKLKFYDAGTSTPKSVYSDGGLSNALGTTVHCDAGGYPVTTEGGSTKTEVYVGTSAYKLVITDADDTTIASHDNIVGAVNTASLSADFAKAEEPVVSVTSSRNIDSDDYGKLLQANSTSGAISLTLPAAATAGDGTRVRVRHVGTAGTVSITAAGSETIDGPQGAASTSYQLVNRGDTVLLRSTGAGWVADALFIPDGSITAAQLSAAISGTFMQTGSIIPWPTAASTPAGYLDCDGSAVSRTTYSELFDVIGTEYGSGDGSTTFNLPDYRGVFLRGFDDGAGNDPDAASRTDRGDGTTGDAVGTAQGHAIDEHSHDAGTLVGANHQHDYTRFSSTTTIDEAAGPYQSQTTSNVWQGTSTQNTVNEGVTINGSTDTTGGNETRPINISVRWLIFTGASAATGASATLHTLLNGSGDPNDELGNNDDFYIDFNSWTIWGPKASGTWAGTDFRLGLVVQGDWSVDIDYVAGDVVQNDGSSYACILDHTASASDEPGVGANTATYWQLLASAGVDGETLNWEGAWQTSTAYSLYDAVSNGGSSYICIQAHTSSASDEPGVGANTATYWNVLAQKGASGAGTGDLLAANNLSDVDDASAARTNLGLEIGTNVQAYDAELAAIAALTSAADKGMYFTGSGTASTFDLTTFGRSLLDDAAAVNARTTLGLAIGSDVQEHGDVLDDLNTLGAPTTDGQFLVATGAGAFAYESGATARASLGLTIGTHVQEYDANLNSISLLGTAANKLLYTTGSETWAEADVTPFARTILDDADEATFKATVNLEPGTDVQAQSALLQDIADITFAQGDVLYYDGSNLAKLGAGSSGQFLKTNGAGANPAWATIPGGGDLLSTNNLSDVGSAATAFSNIKQAASETVTGVVELATTTEAETGTDTQRAVTPAGVAAAIAALGGGGGVPDIILVEEVSNGTDASGTQNTWNARQLNTEKRDVNGDAGALSSGAFTLAAGTWFAQGWAVTQRGGRHKTRIRQTSGTATTHVVGLGMNAQDSNNVMNTNMLAGVFTLASSQTIEFQHFIDDNGAGTNNLGVSSITENVEVEVYSCLMLTKVS